MAKIILIEGIDQWHKPNQGLENSPKVEETVNTRNAVVSGSNDHNTTTRKELAKIAGTSEGSVQNQRARQTDRQLTKTELVQMALAVEKQVAVEAKAAQAEYHGNQHDGLSANLKKVHSEPIVSAQKAAESIGVSENTYRDMKLVLEKGSPF